MNRSYHFTPRELSVEGLESRRLMAVDAFQASLAGPADEVCSALTHAAAEGANGETKWFIADSFSFGVEREMKESGEKGGTEDINIGVGELQECTISKSMDQASAKLAQFAINGNSARAAAIDVIFAADGDAEGESKPICYLKYKLDRAFVKSWSTSGDADDRPTEEVAFYYNKISFADVPELAASKLDSPR